MSTKKLEINDFRDKGNIIDCGGYELDRKILEASDGHGLVILEYPDYPVYLPYKLIGGKWNSLNSHQGFREIQHAIDVMNDPGTRVTNKKECYVCSCTTGLMAGSLGLLCAECYDEIEGDL
jgi:hypothetical protein